MNRRDVISQKREQARLTPKQIAFTKAFIEDPSSATKAAIKAGYSPRSAGRIAYELVRDETIKSILAQHFLDIEKALSNALQDTLQEMHAIVRSGKKVGDRIRASKVLLNYAQIASNVLGLRVKAKAEQEVLTQMSPQELLDVHLREAKRLQEMIDHDKPVKPLGLIAAPSGSPVGAAAEVRAESV